MYLHKNLENSFLILHTRFPLLLIFYDSMAYWLQVMSQYQHVIIN